MPSPSSLTRMSRRPPPSVTISILRRAGVERVFDELLHDARRPLDHLAGGDAVDGGFGQLADGHGFGPAIRMANSIGIAIARRDGDS